MGTKKAIVELDGTQYLFSSSKDAGDFIAAIEKTEGSSQRSYGDDPRPLQPVVEVSLKLMTKEKFVAPCTQCESKYKAPLEGETICENCKIENTKVEVKCDGFPADKDCDSTIKFLPDEVPATALCWSCEKARKKSESDSEGDDE